MDEMEKLELLIDGEVTIQQPGREPAVYRGFRMIAEEKLHALRGDQARRMVQSGMLGLIYAHLFSLTLIPGLHETGWRVPLPRSSRHEVARPEAVAPRSALAEGREQFAVRRPAQLGHGRGSR